MNTYMPAGSDPKGCADLCCSPRGSSRNAALCPENVGLDVRTAGVEVDARASWVTVMSVFMFGWADLRVGWPLFVLVSPMGQEDVCAMSWRQWPLGVVFICVCANLRMNGPLVVLFAGKLFSCVDASEARL